MTSDPREVMSQVVDQEASWWQAVADDDLLGEALAISEAEQQRGRLIDRLGTALGTPVVITLPGETVRGIVREIGADLVVLSSEMMSTVVSLPHVISIEGLPGCLRAEFRERCRVTPTWSSVLRQRADDVSWRLILVDDTCILGRVEVVGSDHVDLRATDGALRTVPFTAIRAAISTR